MEKYRIACTQESKFSHHPMHNEKYCQFRSMRCRFTGWFNSENFSWTQSTECEYEVKFWTLLYSLQAENVQSRAPLSLQRGYESVKIAIAYLYSTIAGQDIEKFSSAYKSKLTHWNCELFIHLVSLQNGTDLNNY